MSPDALPLWFTIPSVVLLWLTLAVLVVRARRTPDPCAHLSRLDRLDGLTCPWCGR